MVQAGMYYHTPHDWKTGYLAQQTQTGALVLVKPGSPDDALLIVNDAVFNQKIMVRVCGVDELLLVRV